jgi:UDP-2,3-diacylglucosamine pyrophosphatase LpxH
MDRQDLSETPFLYHFRAVFISDIHLGTTGCKADMLLDFLRHMDCQFLYLVGDIVDGWRLKKSWYWPQAHNDVVQKIMRRGRKGTQVFYIPGNHDEFARTFLEDPHLHLPGFPLPGASLPSPLTFGNIEICNEALHVTADGKKLLILHGDKFDGLITHAPFIAHLGDHAYEFFLKVNTLLNNIRRRLGFPYWSLSAYLKRQVKQALQHIDGFAQLVTEDARRHGADGVVCGHIHTAEIKQIGDILYCNDGDWVESCTALVEHFDGRLEILHWADIIKNRQTQPELTL